MRASGVAPVARTEAAALAGTRVATVASKGRGRNTPKAIVNVNCQGNVEAQDGVSADASPGADSRVATRRPVTRKAVNGPRLAVYGARTLAGSVSRQIGSAIGADGTRAL